jgi:hypothetical protein
VYFDFLTVLGVIDPRNVPVGNNIRIIGSFKESVNGGADDVLFPKELDPFFAGIRREEFIQGLKQFIPFLL